MTLGLLLGVPLALIVVYGFWMASRLGCGPSWRRESTHKHAGEERD
jgi:hypothetical protein